MNSVTSRANARISRRLSMFGKTAVAVSLLGWVTSSAVAGPTGVILTKDGRLHSFDTSAPSNITGSVTISGTDPFEDLLGIDFRPAQPKVLFALSSFGQLYHINPLTGSATKVGSELDPDVVPLEADNYGFDFNPAVDRIRVVSDLGGNYRIHPDTGALVSADGGLNYVAGDPNRNEFSTVTASAYTNNDNDPATGTVLYNIDSDLGVLAIQNPPNAGGLETVGSLGLSDRPLFAGFDIAGAENTALAVTAAEPAFFGLPELDSRLYGINLETGLATDLGIIGDGSLEIAGFAMTDQLAAIPLPPALFIAPAVMVLAGVCQRRFRRGG